MRQIRRHVKQVARFQLVRFSGEEKFAFAGQYLDERVLGGSVLAQFLPGGKTEQDDATIRRAKNGAADDAVFREFGFVGERKDFLRAGFD